MSLTEIVYNFKTKNIEGFTQAEVEKLLKSFHKVNRKKFDESLMGNTCMLKGKEAIMYHHYVLKALECSVENNDLFS